MHAISLWTIILCIWCVFKFDQTGTGAEPAHGVLGWYLMAQEDVAMTG